MVETAIWHEILRIDAKSNMEPDDQVLHKERDSHECSDLFQRRRALIIMKLGEDTVVDDNATAVECINDGENAIPMDAIMKSLTRMKVRITIGYNKLSSEVLRGDGGPSAGVRMNGAHTNWFDIGMDDKPDEPFHRGSSFMNRYS
ncbi:hypothetical protein EVAR_60376_1 [Eumeta japonica]|uniref:Uncharacterized protein n=1 Tax=Eumeta variegata TaxID=151549 RepID=A0A4C1ZR98_EUMVA|nr:hypothetical protein EVAR_60376_1 [Eumeta japonica]